MVRIISTILLASSLTCFGQQNNAALWFGFKSPASGGGPDYTNGIVNWLKFNETSGTTANDSSGNGNNGTLINFSGSYWGNPGLNFIAADSQQVQISSTGGGPFPPLNVQSLTICAWVNYTPNSIYQAIYGIGQEGSDGSPEFRINPSGYLEFLNQGVVLLGTSTTVVSPGALHHVSVSFNESTGAIAFYIDGTAAGTAIETGVNFTYSFSYLCWGDGYTSEYFNGLMRDARLYSVALTQSQIQQIYNGGTPRY